MATKLNNTIFSCIPDLGLHNGQFSSPEFKLSDLSPEKLAAWGVEHSTDFSYRAELARRIALAYDDADQIILFDDISLIDPEWEGLGSLGIRGLDRTLLPALWLSTGFRRGSRMLAYSPPNSIEMSNYLGLKKQLEEQLQRSIHIQVLYEDSTGHLLNLIELFEKSIENYTNVCEAFARQFSREYYPKYYLDMFHRHIEIITQDCKRSFVFPYQMSQFHQEELQPYSDRLKMPDMPTHDKAKHNLFLRTKGFDALPKLLAISTSGIIIDNYEQYIDLLKHFDSVHAENTAQNREVFARTIIQAINQLYQQYNMKAFLQFDSSGSGGWSSMSPTLHPIIYDFEVPAEERISYLYKYIEKKVNGTQIPPMAIVQEFIEPQIRSDDVDADYTVCGFVLDSIFFPTSISLGDTTDGEYIALWNSSSPVDLCDSSDDWQRMFELYSRMVALEASEFNYYNGIYAGDLFLTKDGHHKQHDWNIRRGARSSPESFVIFGMPTYETKVTLMLTDIGLHGQLNNIDLFHVYNQTCESLSNDHGMYVLATTYGYFGKDDKNSDFLKFNIIIHPKCLLNVDSNGQKQILSRSEHRIQVVEIIRTTANKFLRNRQ